MTAITGNLDWSRRSQMLILLCGCLSLSIFAVSQRLKWWSIYPTTAAPAASDDQVDAALQTAATNALGTADGAIIVLDPQTGRIRAVVNQGLAFGQTFAPGSTIKPFTALAAMQSGLIDKHSRRLCHQHYVNGDFETVCSHPADLPAFDTEEALAYSCNYYFGKLGERLNEDAFRSTLTSFGFGRMTGANVAEDAPGKIGAAKWSSRAALGEGPYSQVTAAQLIAAYAGLANGGRVFTPRIHEGQNFQTRVAANVPIDPEQRAVILAGMRDAVRFGTAGKSGLSSLSLNVFGKTGTSTPFKGFRTQGWFVGLASDSDGDSPAAESFTLAVLVFLKRSHGSDAAAVSRPIFEEFARNRGVAAGVGDGETAGRGAPSPHLPVSPSPHPPISPVRVHLVHENVTVQLPFEDYVLQVVATEGSTEAEPEALKALAIAVRTYALKNRARHEKEGFNFCTTTHCQRFQVATGSAPTPNRIIDAVRSTAGEVLIDDQGRVAEAYFGASCGGATANEGTLWGGDSPSYLRGVPDDYCAAMPHSHWTDVIPRAQLLAALRSDPRTDVGGRLDDVSISRRDKTDRAELITLTGEKRMVVRGWDFKLIVGRALGWQRLKSSRFSVQRNGSDFVFHGSGFGHGLGLCQEGAHVMAQRGVDYRRILAKYFPGTTIAEDDRSVADSMGGPRSTPDSGSEQWQADVLLSRPRNQPAAFGRSSSAHLNVSSEHFRLGFSPQNDRRDIAAVLSTLESTRAELLRRAATTRAVTALPTINVNINDTTGDFVGRTGQPWWAAAATRGNQIELQPLEVLKRRGSLHTALRHELAHVFIDAVSRSRAPHWLAEGFALYLAGEGRQISRYADGKKLAIAELESKLEHAGSPEEMRAAYAAAYREVSGIIKSEGEAAIWKRMSEK
jgi:stage II sporulation protein D